MIYGYCRCSTTALKQDITRQVRELKEMGVSKENIFKEYISTSKSDRTELNRLMNIVKAGDTIIATEVSRLTRSTKELCSIIEFCKEKKIKLQMGTFVVDCTTELDPMTQGMLMMMGVFAELERNIISARVKSGMENARAKGKHIGRPSGIKIPANLYPLYSLYVNGSITKKDFATMCNVSRPTLDKYIKVLEKQEQVKK